MFRWDMEHVDTDRVGECETDVEMGNSTESDDGDVTDVDTCSDVEVMGDL